MSASNKKSVALALQNLSASFPPQIHSTITNCDLTSNNANNAPMLDESLNNDNILSPEEISKATERLLPELNADECKKYYSLFEKWLKKKKT